ncbi:riboflavin synthase [Aestuariispira insulae]|uniref:Riboflavin synthase n=1 Tax=Aestuariispira insulae TaxID=1461337 RepID=A0A3D9HVD8_9PROT|nr:riboflavin synthase [Aestuariispira insulae]RED53375.1 riboflavin synthase alpha chain [Aestuariispira insulae]
MFTGIITDIGTVRSVETKGDTTYVIETSYDMDSVDIGASIACSGVCLTVTEKGTASNGKGWFSTDASEETLSLTTARNWEVGTRLNLERALKLGDELGGHMVLGHVDGKATIVGRELEGDSIRFRFQVPENLMQYIAAKGSVVLNGVSLTINEVEGDVFGVNIIPHTASETTFGEVSAGDEVNIEVDALARYVARLMDHRLNS